MKRVNFVLSFVFRVIKFKDTHIEDKEKVILLTYQFIGRNPSVDCIANDIWKKLILENKELMRECFIPNIYMRQRDELKLELGTVTGDKYEWREVASRINQKIRKAEEAYDTLHEITVKI